MLFVPVFKTDFIFSSLIFPETVPKKRGRISFPVYSLENGLKTHSPKLRN